MWMFSKARAKIYEKANGDQKIIYGLVEDCINSINKTFSGYTSHNIQYDTRTRLLFSFKFNLEELLFDFDFKRSPKLSIYQLE